MNATWPRRTRDRIRQCWYARTPKRSVTGSMTDLMKHAACLLAEGQTFARGGSTRQGALRSTKRTGSWYPFPPIMAEFD
jgi:hypothetical protein